MGTQADTTIRAVLRCADEAPGVSWPRLLLGTRVAGLPLLQRHLLALRQAEIASVSLAAPPAIVSEIEAASRACVPAGIQFSVVAEGGDRDVYPELAAWPALEQRADTVVDPRLLAQIVRLARTSQCDVVCVDRAGATSDPETKSPYNAGVPDPDEAEPVQPDVVADMVPIGLAVRGIATPSIALGVGRYYWQRVSGADEAATATRKVLLSTMKATDGIFARTNRRVSLRISRLLLDTPVTPNIVTVATLVWGLVAGWLLSRGQHATFVAGALFAWFASMLDGVDGELARAKFQSSAFGHWLEMVCDYAFYIALFVGLGAGVQRIKGDPIWLLVGIGAAVGVVVSFAAVARLKRAYARQGSMGDFYLAYQRTVGGGSNLFLRMTPHLMALMTRAGFPYLLIAIAILDMPRGMLVSIFIATHAFWMTALYATRLRVTLQPASSAPRLEPAIPSPHPVGVAEIE